jgi:hypothetical protein
MLRNDTLFCTKHLKIQSNPPSRPQTPTFNVSKTLKSASKSVFFFSFSEENNLVGLSFEINDDPFVGLSLGIDMNSKSERNIDIVMIFASLKTLAKNIKF